MDTIESVPGQSERGPIWFMELIATLLLGLAAVGAGWAAYQSTKWGSAETFTLDQANLLRRNAALLENKGQLMRVVDVALFLDYLKARNRGDTRLANFLLDRFPAHLRIAVDAWLATKPLKNPDAPPTPFGMREYRIEEDGEALRLQEEVQRVVKEAQRQSDISDRYVLVTVPFAVVSLFCGLSSKAWAPQIRMIIVAMAAVVFLGAVVALALLPVN